MRFSTSDAGEIVLAQAHAIGASLKARCAGRNPHDFSGAATVDMLFEI
jgi:hypothetical protein